MILLIFHISELSVAAIENNYEAIDELIEKGCDPNDNGTSVLWRVSGWTPLHLAAYFQSIGSKMLIHPNV